MSIPPINLQDKLSRFSEHWQPKIIAEMNDDQCKLVELRGVVNTGDDTVGTMTAPMDVWI